MSTLKVNSLHFSNGWTGGHLLIDSECDSDQLYKNTNGPFYEIHFLSYKIVYKLQLQASVLSNLCEPEPHELLLCNFCQLLKNTAFQNSYQVNYTQNFIVFKLSKSIHYQSITVFSIQYNINAFMILMQ